MDGDKPGGLAKTSNGLHHQKRQLALGISHFLIMGLSKKNCCRSYSSQCGVFTYLPFLFCLKKDANNLFPADLPGRRLPEHGAAVATPPDPTPTRSRHWEKQPEWKGLRTGTCHLGGGTRRFGSHGDKPDGGMLQQSEGIRHEGQCSATIPRRWSTRQHGVGVARPDQRVGE